MNPCSSNGAPSKHWCRPAGSFLKFRLVVLVLGLLAVGCTNLDNLLPTATQPGPPTATPAAESSPQASPSPSAPTSLRLWLPARFDPNSGTPAGDLLQARLDEFARLNNVDIDVRVKDETGPGGLLDALSTANAAAPLALPDLILLPRSQLETAALKGLVFPLEGMVDPVDEGDWYPYATQLARLQDSTFGLPFAGDAQVLTYRPEKISQPPVDWSALLSLDQALAFPAADDQSLFTLAQYQAAGGSVQDDEGRPTLQPRPLTSVLSFFQQGAEAEVLPLWVTQMNSAEQVWDSFTTGRADQAIVWAHQFLANPSADTSIARLPTPGGEPFTLANGWVWAFSSPQLQSRELSLELAQMLTAGDFLSQWTAAAGYLPPRASALDGWQDASLRAAVDAIARSARIIPANDVAAVLGPALQLATVDVLKSEAEPARAAQEAVKNLQSPE